MIKLVYNPLSLAKPAGHFDRAVRLDDWLFVSGTSALTDVPGALSERRLVVGTMAQARTTLDNIEKVLDAAGASLQEVYRMRVILRRWDDLPIVNEILRDRMPRSGYIVHAHQGSLAHPEMEIEIETSAYLGKAMTKTVIRAEDAPLALWSEAAVQVGDWVFLAAPVSARTRATRMAGAGDSRAVKGLSEQAHQALTNIDNVMRRVGGSLGDVYELQVTLREASGRHAAFEAIRERVGHGRYIAHIYYEAPLHPSIEIQIEANAYLSAERGKDRVRRQ